MEVETLIAEWATGVRQEPRAGRTIVLDADDWIPALIAGNLLDDSSRVFHRDAAGLPTGLRCRAETFAGSLLGADTDLRFGNGLVVRQGHYGGSEFLSVDGPVILRVSDDDDFSAFLRDADVAWTTGRFSQAVTSPQTLIADLCGLGGPADSGGPDDRIFVTATGVVSTSPTGRRLGVAGEPWELIQRRWDELNGASRRPCAVCLAGVLDEQDRADALAERPWLSRYLDVIAVIRVMRAGHLDPSQVSGFGGRLNSTLPWAAPDDRRAPILIVVGDKTTVADPVSRRWIALDGRTAAAAEALVALDRAAAVTWCARAWQVDEPDAAVVVADVLAALAGSALATEWTEERQGQPR